MNDDIRNIMVQYKILTEGELYCTTLADNLGEDSVNSINAKIKEVQENYSEKIKGFTASRKYKSLDYAKAIYFSAYYNNENTDFFDYVASYSHNTKLDIFKFHDKYMKRKISLLEEDFMQKLRDFSYYQKTLKKGKISSDSKIAKILLHK